MMSFTEKATLVGVSVGISALLAWGISKSISEGTRGGSDDAPIIVGGGSLYFGTGALATFTRVSDDELRFAPDFKVSAIDWIDSDGKTGSVPVLLNEGNITVKFCGNQNCTGAGNVDMVRLSFKPGSPISLTNELKGVGNSHRLLPNLWRHPKKNWTVDSMAITVGVGVPMPVKCLESACGVYVHSCTDGKLCK